MRRALAPPPPLPVAASAQQGGRASVSDCQGLRSHAAAHKAGTTLHPPRLLIFCLVAARSKHTHDAHRSHHRHWNPPALHPASTPPSPRLLIFLLMAATSQSKRRA